MQKDKCLFPCTKKPESLFSGGWNWGTSDMSEVGYKHLTEKKMWEKIKWKSVYQTRMLVTRFTHPRKAVRGFYYEETGQTKRRHLLILTFKGLPTNCPCVAQQVRSSTPAYKTLSAFSCLTLEYEETANIARLWRNFSLEKDRSQQTKNKQNVTREETGKI